MNLESMMNTALDFLSKTKDAFVNFDVVDFLDIIVVAAIVFAIIRLFKKSQSFQLIGGIAVIAFVYLVVTFLGLTATKFLFSKVLSDIFIIFVIVFSPEIRRGLSSLGKGRFKGAFSEDDPESAEEVIVNVVEAVGQMADKNVGALIVFKRKDSLGSLIGRGEKIDALVTANLLGNIFFPKSPLHDGAAVIEDGRIVTARGVVELSNDVVLEGKYGTRHRAGVVVSKETDAFVVMVSEERGEISVAENGRLYPNISTGELRQRLVNVLVPETDSKKRKKMKHTADGGADDYSDYSDAEKQISIDDPILPGEEAAGPEDEPAPQASGIIVNEGDVNDEQE